MQINSAREFFETLAARGREPRLAGSVGTWQFDIEGAGTWTVSVDHGALRVSDGQLSREPGQAASRVTTLLRLGEEEFLRLVRGDGHENLFTALIRGALALEGELAFGQKLQAILPAPEEWRVGT